MMARLNTTLYWMNRDARLLTVARGARTFSQSFVSIIMALYRRNWASVWWRLERSLPPVLPEYRASPL